MMKLEITRLYVYERVSEHNLGTEIIILLFGLIHIPIIILLEW